MDMAKFSKDEKNVLHCPKCNKEFPAQGRERLYRIIETVRANQGEVAQILSALVGFGGGLSEAEMILDELHKNDRDAILQSNGILTGPQIEALK